MIWLQKDGAPSSVRLPQRKPNGAAPKSERSQIEPKREYLDYLEDRYDVVWKLINKSIPRDLPLVTAILAAEKQRRAQS